MKIMTEKESIDKKNAVIQLCSLFAPGYKVSFTPRSMMFMKDGSTIMVDESNFAALQEILSQVFCVNNGPMDT